MKILKTQVLVGAIVLAGSATGIFAQLKYSGCADVTKADFKKVPLITSSQHKIVEPIQMALSKDGRIFWIEREGMIRMWEPTKPDAAVNLISLPVFTEVEFGASGIALDPGFEANKWIYAFWTVNTQNADGSRNFRVSRFTLANNALDMASQKTIIEIPVTNFSCCHTAGSMIFDFAGNLFIAVGNTTKNSGGENQTPKINYVNHADFHGDDQRGSANTNSLLGKILRIKPKALSEGGASPAPGVGSTYDIPTGNLFPVGQHPAGKTRPEIYTMGHRNPYTIHVDPYRNWLTWGDIGPDEELQSEEHNLVTKPGFMGWPYFFGANVKYRGTVGISPENMDPNKPLNKSPNNTGLEELPPAQPAIRPYRQSAAITGPIYYYDGRQTAAYRLPPHFNKKWMFTDFNRGYVRVATPADDGKSISDDMELFSEGFLSRPLDMEIGPEGALYVLDYDGWFNAGTKTGISRVEYTGNCVDQKLFPAAITALRDADRLNGLGQDRLLAADLRSGSLLLPEGVSGVGLYDLKGVLVYSFRKSGTQGAERIDIPAHLRGSLLKARFSN